MRKLIFQPFTGGIIEEYHAEFFAKIGPDFAGRLVTQQERDFANAKFRPRLESLEMSEQTELGILGLGARIHSGFATTIFRVIDRPDILIKYQVQFERLSSSVHPLLRDAWLMDEAHEHGHLSPRVFAVSPPSLLCPKQVGKCAFKLPERQYRLCQLHHCTVRYMVMERFEGHSLHRLILTGRRKLSVALVIGIHLMHKLRDLHMTAGVVHGDIHTGNVLIVKDGSAVNGVLKFVDFGCAFPYSTDMPTDPENPSGFWYDYLLSSWQMRGFAWSARDDVARAIQIIAQLMHPPDAYYIYEKKIERSGFYNMMRWKESGYWFRIPGFDPVERLENVGFEERRLIMEHLGHILKLVRSLKINDQIPYDLIIQILEECAAFASPGVAEKLAASRSTKHDPVVVTTSLVVTVKPEDEVVPEVAVTTDGTYAVSRPTFVLSNDSTASIPDTTKFKEIIFLHESQGLQNGGS